LPSRPCWRSWRFRRLTAALPSPYLQDCPMLARAGSSFGPCSQYLAYRKASQEKGIAIGVFVRPIVPIWENPIQTERSARIERRGCDHPSGCVRGCDFGPKSRALATVRQAAWNRSIQVRFRS
jgi:hypothetical protein